MKYKVCDKFKIDLWGNLLSCGKDNRFTYLYLESFASRKTNLRLSTITVFNSLEKRKRSKFLRKNALLLQHRSKLRSFYGKYIFSKINKIKVDALSLGQDVRVSIFQSLESRLAVVVYRLNFVSSIEEGHVLCKAGYFLVNKELIYDGNYLVDVGSIVEVSLPYKVRVAERLEKRIALGRLWVLCPKYLEVNYKGMLGMLWRLPRINLDFKKRKVLNRKRRRSYFRMRYKDLMVNNLKNSRISKLRGRERFYRFFREEQVNEVPYFFLRRYNNRYFFSVFLGKI